MLNALSHKKVRCLSVLWGAGSREVARSGRLQLFHDLWHSENIDCPRQIVREYMQTHLRLHIR